MQVIVDMDKCKDHGQCVFASPTVFQLDDAGHLVYNAEPEDGLRDEVEEAADVCPLQAITIKG